MSVRLTSSMFFKCAFFAFLTQFFAFSGKNELETTNETASNPGGLVNAPSPFDVLPSDIIKVTLQKLKTRDLKNIRLVEKKLYQLATQLIQHIRVPNQLSDLNPQRLQMFLKNLQNVTILWNKNPSEAALSLFRNVSVKMLQLDHQGVGTQGIQILAPHLPTALHMLGLGGNDIRDAGVKALAPHLPTTLQWLDLGNNNIGDPGVQALTPYLPASLRQLYLGNNNIGDAGAQALAPYLPPILQQLWLANNNIGDAGTQALALHLPPTLQQLWLAKNNIKDAGFTALLEAIPRTVLETLTISIPSNSPFRKEFKKLHNQQGNPIIVIFLE